MRIIKKNIKFYFILTISKSMTPLILCVVSLHSQKFKKNFGLNN